jgi:hypothetical protein
MEIRKSSPVSILIGREMGTDSRAFPCKNLMSHDKLCACKHIVTKIKNKLAVIFFILPPMTLLIAI